MFSDWLLSLLVRPDVDWRLQRQARLQAERTRSWAGAHPARPRWEGRVNLYRRLMRPNRLDKPDASFLIGLLNIG